MHWIHSTHIDFLGDEINSYKCMTELRVTIGVVNCQDFLLIFLSNMLKNNFRDQTVTNHCIKSILKGFND